MTGALLDTSVLGRLANRSDASHLQARAAVSRLRQGGAALYVTAQNLVEFRNFATRPADANGLGLSAADAGWHSAVFEACFPLLAETPAVYPAWRSLADGLGIVGKQVHDARLVAVCHVHGVSHVVTFNVGHFRRLAAFGPGVTVLDARADSGESAASPTPSPPRTTDHGPTSHHPPLPP